MNRLTPGPAGELLRHLPEPRIKPFLQAAQGDELKALGLYAWNARMAGAALEQLSHLEVLLRHAIDKCLSKATDEANRQIPWFLVLPYSAAQPEVVEAARVRLRALGRETRDQTVAAMPFGYWTGWLGKKYEELWRHWLQLAFPHGSGTRKEVSALAEQIRKFRNRIAHHDSLLNVDVGFEMDAVFKLAAIINPDVAAWMRSIDRPRQVGRDRPVSIADTVVVPTSEAWSLYKDQAAHICQAGRFFRPVDHIAFYSDRQIHADVPRIKSRQDNVVWSNSEASRLMASDSRDDRRLGKIMSESIKRGWTHGIYQVFLLTRPADPAHVTLHAPLLNERSGKGSAFVRKQRYTSIHELRHATTVWDLDTGKNAAEHGD